MVSRRRQHGIRLLLAMLVAFSAMRVAPAAEISVRTDRDPVAVGESFQIVFEATEDVDGDPDFAPLQKDFQVLSTGQSSSFSMINGDMARSKRWNVTVLARRAGRLTVPAIHFGRDRSPEHPIAVANAAGGKGQAESGDIFLEVEAAPLRPYVQAQVVYTVRLYRAVSTSNASLNDPKVETGDAVIERLGEDRTFETRVMGRRYLVVERSFAIYPQTSGTLTIAPLQFQAQAGRSSFSLLDPFGPQPKTVLRQSASVSLEVAPVPAAFSGRQWIPARQVRISDEWSQQPPSFRVGEPITRTLSITADGLTASQLPEFPGGALPEFKSYPDQPALSDSRSPLGIIGTRQEKIALIPSRPGDYMLPEIRIPWWNTTANRMEYATLPERRIHVLPPLPDASAAMPEAKVAAPGSKGDVEPPAATADLPASEPAVAAVQALAGDKSRLWQAISLVLALGWLLTIVVAWRKTRSGGNARSADGNRRIGGAIRAVQNACSANDPRRAKDALLRWSALIWADDPPHSIGAIEARCGRDMARELADLNSALYGRDAATWRGAGLWKAFSAEPAALRPPARETPGGLQPLYRL